MRRRPKLTAFLVLLLLFIAYRMVTFGRREEVKDVDAIQAELGVPVDVEEVARGEIEVWKEYAGEVQGMIQAQLSSSFPDRVVGLYFKEGTIVDKDETVIELEEDSPSSRYMQAKAAYQNARREYQRLLPLYREGAISERELDAAKTALDVAEADLATSKSTIQLTSPISGVLTYLGVNVGERVVPGRALATIAKIDTVRVMFHVVQDDAVMIEDGTRVSVHMGSDGEHNLEGRVTEVSLSPDPGTRLFRVEALIANENYLLRPDTLVPIKVAIEGKRDVLIIARDALVRSGNDNAVYVIEGETGVLRNVETGLETENEVEVKEGLNEGDLVVVRGQNRLRDGMKVRISKDSSRM
ncbi:MAG: efflux RND transporter periplasmic adaptor subunit [Candidatus Glassbacteria bacterium]